MNAALLEEALLYVFEGELIRYNDPMTPQMRNILFHMEELNFKKLKLGSAPGTITWQNFTPPLSGMVGSHKSPAGRQEVKK